MRHRTVQNLLYDYLNDELSAPEAAQVRDHLARCNKCFGEQQIIKESIRLLQPKQVKPSESLSETYWHNFAVEILHQVQSGAKKENALKLWWESNRYWFLSRKSYSLSIAGGLALVILAVFLWPLTRSVDPEVGNSIRLVSESPDEQVNQELSDYFHKSKILLVGISNIRSEDVGNIDLSVERDAARNLVRQARTFDHKEVDARSRMLIKAMEKILIELANMEERDGLSDVELIRTGIREENMLFKIRMAETAAGARQENSDKNNN
ncbi:MAG: zf-HC2 domain-containing protein [bacterium]